MADNVAITPGSGATAAADEIAGILYQRIKLIHGADGVNDGDVSAANGLPVQGTGELLEAIEALRMAVQALTRTVGMSTVDATGRLRVASESTVVSSGTVTTVSTLTNQTQIGGQQATDQIPALMTLRADNLRRNISVT